jgi:hypothetical protein
MPDVNMWWVEQGGAYRFLGCNAPRPDFGGLPKWSANQPVLPQSQWAEFDRRDPRVPVLNQGQHGSCVGHGGATAFSMAWLASGQTFRRFSPCYLYGNINGGRDAGAIVSDAMQSLQRTGIALEEQVPEGQVYRQSSWSQFDATAQRFRIADAYHCETFDDLGSAAQLGFFICYGILVGNGFTSLDNEGVPGVGGRGGHCMAGGDAMKRSSRWGWLIHNRNSWGQSYGDNGCCYLAKQHFEYGGYLDSFAIRLVANDPQETDVPPPLV